MIPIGATHKMRESFYKLKKVRGEVFWVCVFERKVGRF